jgi:hypothetical protein
MPPDDFGEGVLRIFPREPPQQIQIACHAFESISPLPGKIRQKFPVAVRKHLYFRHFVAQFGCRMTRRSPWISTVALAGLLAAQISSRADITDAAPVKSAIFEGNVAYLRVGLVGTNLADEIIAALTAQAVSNKIAGTVLDLRFAGGDDLDSARATADLFAAEKMPLAILVNGQTRGAAAALAADLRDKRAGLVFGSAPEPDASGGGKYPAVQPDISVAVALDDERDYLQNPYGPPPQNDPHPTAAGKNDFLPFVDHTTEADLVRGRIKDGDQDENSAPQLAPQPQVIRDPVLARAVDLIKGLAVVRAAHS